MGNPFNHSPYEEGEEKSRKPGSKFFTKYKGITRIDTEANHTHGWYVRVRKHGKVYSKFFSDRKHGGAANALNKARRYYKKQMQAILAETLGEIPDKLPTRTVVTRNKKNNTGVVGVQRIERKNPGGTVYRAYRVCWTDKDGKSRTRFFSVKKYGDEEAFRLACEFRKQKLFE
ncbi:MAG: AP2 domain-containing protein [Calditrichaeota bacterium]|nr:MAG: AP2 domain-containing protein [Calditrichota bacterium]